MTLAFHLAFQARVVKHGQAIAPEGGCRITHSRPPDARCAACTACVRASRSFTTQRVTTRAVEFLPVISTQPRLAKTPFKAQHCRVVLVQ
ncbi:hypothetical protein Bxe_B1275 [Paraburkholderia xenovorans LB400]|uniref:Uncharacterized protein n=1 Tax=Paraburkholderia xenovorans (strain LB400) TaxID=266265 RepID=Q13MK5_PARXL|nr:hypothetical protein Bxe_B1275 [Paraburkholderia xenovorans LB400]